MSHFYNFKVANRFFETFAHRNKKYHVGNVSFQIVLFHALNHTRYISPELHSQSTLELSLIEEGSIEYFTQNTNIFLGAGDVFFMPPGILHNWRAVKRPFVITGFQLLISCECKQADFLKQLELKASRKNYSLKNTPIFSDLMEKIRKQITCKALYVMENVDCLILEFLIEFMRKVPLQAESPISQHRNLANTRASIIKDFVKSNLANPLGLTDVANHLNLSTRQLNRLLVKEEGVPLGTYILNLKMEAARNELAYTDKLVKEIAFALGFDDINYFGRIFRKKTGYTPTKYRQDKRNL